MLNLATKIIKYKVEHQLTFKDMAIILNMPRQYLSKAVNGKLDSVPIKHVVAICNHFEQQYEIYSDVDSGRVKVRVVE